MIGPLEIVIVVVLVLILFGAYKRLPALGRSAGTGARKGGEKAKQLAAQAREKADGVDTSKIGESVGKGLREAREVRDSVKGIASDDAPKSEPAGTGEPADGSAPPPSPERPSGQ